MGCRTAVEAELRAVGGARLIQVDLGAQTVTAVSDPAHASVDALRSPLGRTGYQPRGETVAEG